MVSALFGCGNEGIAVLGGNTHRSDRVELLTIAGPDVLQAPTDLAFRPDAPSELWVTVRDTNSVVVIDAPGSDAQRTMEYAALGNAHFLPRPAALAFGANGTMATIHEIDVPTQRETPANFMGPTLWPTDRGLFDGGHASHLDMLHNSPNGVGIAWDHDNVYWVVDGAHRSITRYDFAMDHGPGNEDHSDGIISRFVEGEIGYVAEVPAHAELDHETGLLYVADPEHSRVVVLDTRSGAQGRAVGPNYDGCEMHAMDGATLATLIDGAAVGLVRPSGLALHDGMVFVSDAQNSTIAAFDRASGALIDWISLAAEVPAGGLGGLAVDGEGRLYVADTAGSRVLRLAPR